MVGSGCNKGRVNQSVGHMGKRGENENWRRKRETKGSKWKEKKERKADKKHEKLENMENGIIR